jgi:hypothetical protein
MSEDQRSRLNNLKCRGLIGKACGIHKSGVSQIYRDVKKSIAQRDPVFVLPRNKRKGMFYKLVLYSCICVCVCVCVHVHVFLHLCV